MARPLAKGMLALVALTAAHCAPPAEPAAPSQTVTTTTPPTAPASGRTAIRGPEASRITIDQLGQRPPIGPHLPRLVQYSPDGKLITYLQSEGANSRVMALFAFDVATRTSKKLLDGGSLVKEKSENVSREEELRRERRRMFAQGVTSYQWAKRAPVMIIPFAGDVFLRDEKGAMSRLTETPAPELDAQICEGGERVAFVRDRDLFTVDLASRREAQLTRGAPEGVTRGISDFNAQEEFDEPSGYWISPGCDRIAYLEVDEREVGTVPVMGYRGGQVDWMLQRYPLVGQKTPKVRVGVVDLKSKKTTWLSWPTEEERYYGRFEWSPDGKALYFQTISRDQKRLSLVRADPGTGATTEVLTETSPTWVELANMKLLEKAPKLVWTTATGGHFHLELRDAGSGTRLSTLTSGDWDVQAILDVDEAKGEVVFWGTKDGPLERHAYAVPLAGGAPRRLTPEAGFHRVFIDPKRASFVDAHSAAGRMWKVVVRGNDGAPLGELPTPVDAELATLDLRTPSFAEVRAANGDTLHGALLAPRHVEPGKRYPVVVMVYGGPQVQTVTDAWEPRLLWNHLADRDVVVFQLDNRGSGGRGQAFEAQLYGRPTEVELADQIAGLDYLKTLPFVDSGRVGIYGGSYGGKMALAALLKAPDRFQVGIAASPAVDERLYDTGYTERYVNLLQNNAAGYEAADLSRYAGNLRGKLLLMHGLMDENVHFIHTAKMIDALVAANKRFDLMVFPGERHGYVSPAASRYAMQRIVDYLAENL